MNVGNLLAEHLKTVPAISTLVADRVYWPRSPSQVAMPHVRVSPIDGGRLHNLDFAAPSLQVSALGKNATTVASLADALISYLRDARLTLGGAYVVLTYGDDQFLEEEDGWFHAPITINAKLQEA